MRGEPRQLLMLAITPSNRSNHAGLSVMIKRSAINRLATVRGLMATMINHAARTMRYDTGRCASIQALSARDKVRQIGSLIGSLTDASLSAANRHWSSQIERLRAAAGSNGRPQD